jgi:hypothetical protein
MDSNELHGSPGLNPPLLQDGARTRVTSPTRHRRAGAGHNGTSTSTSDQPIAATSSPPYAPAFVTVKRAAAITGYTEKAIRRKIEDGVWLESREYRRAPDGKILVSMNGFDAWVEKGRA